MTAHTLRRCFDALDTAEAALAAVAAATATNPTLTQQVRIKAKIWRHAALIDSIYDDCGDGPPFNAPPQKEIP